MAGEDTGMDPGVCRRAWDHRMEDIRISESWRHGLSEGTSGVTSLSNPSCSPAPPPLPPAQTWATSVSSAFKPGAGGGAGSGSPAGWARIGPSAYPGAPALFGSFRHCVLRLTENNSQPLMTKLQWLFAFLEHSQVRAGELGRGGEEAASYTPPFPKTCLHLAMSPHFLV